MRSTKQVTRYDSYPFRVWDGKEWTVWYADIHLDLPKIVKKLGPKAARNKSGKSKMAGGIQVVAKRAGFVKRAS